MKKATITDGICSGLDLAERDSTPNVPLPTHEAWIRLTLFRMFRKKRSPVTLNPIVKGEQVVAHIDFCRWLAGCECSPGAKEYVTPGEGIFFCFNCFNANNKGHPRPVKFPSDKKRLEIERLIMERPVDDLIGGTKLSKALNAKPLIKTAKGDLGRSWDPGETAADLKRQNKAIKKAVK